MSLSTAPALEIRSLGKRYGDFVAVDNLNLSVPSGVIFGFLGPNGAGKTTTISSVVGLVKPTSGSLHVFGEDAIQNPSGARRLVGLMHQEIVADTFITVDQALKYQTGYYGFEDDPEWRKFLCARLALGPHVHKRPQELSGGTKRRLMLAKALIHKPRLLILDEPTAGVDVELRRGIWQLVRELHAGGMTILLTTHYLEEAEAMCSRIAIMRAGKIVADDATEKLLLGRRDLEEVFLELTGDKK